MPKTIIIGDIHGCYAELLDLLDRLEVASDDKLICVGDLIVKGPRNREVLDLFIDDPRFSSVLGNHDRGILRGWRQGKILKPDQDRCRRELEIDRARYEKYLAALPTSIKFDDYAVVHAGVRPGIDLAAQAENDLVVLRTLGRPDPASRDGVPWYDVYDGDEFVFFGHWAAGGVRRGRRALGLDTACVYGGRLTAYVVEDDRLVDVPARAAYSDFGRLLTMPK